MPDDILCTETEISEFLMSLDVTKASDSVSISAGMLKETAMHISPSPTRILIFVSKLELFLLYGGKLLEKHFHNMTANHFQYTTVCKCSVGIPEWKIHRNCPISKYWIQGRMCVLFSLI